MKRQICGIDAFKLHFLHHNFGEVKPGSGSGNGTFVAGENSLESLQIFRLRRAVDLAGNGRFSERVERALEFIVVAVVQETQGATAARGVVDDLGDLRKEQI